jgi:hypothetical protein
MATAATEQPPLGVGAHSGGHAGIAASLADPSHANVPQGISTSTGTTVWSGSLVTGGSPSSDIVYDPDTAAAGRKAMAEFMRTARAYDVVPESSKVVVFDLAVPVRLAFYALVEHGEYARGCIVAARSVVTHRESGLTPAFVPRCHLKS